VQSTLIDAGPLIALFSARDRHYAHYDDLVHDLAADGLRLVTTWPCVVEASYLLNDASRFALLEWISLGGVIVYPFAPENLPDMVTVMKRYTEVGKREMDLADASLYWLAAETGVRTIMTVDQRDFSRYQLPNGDWFTIL